MNQDTQDIFIKIKDLLCIYVPPFTIQNESERRVDLSLVRNVELNGRTYTNLFFAAAIIQKGYVGFYFMPIYTNPELQNQLSPVLLKTLKGKSCFHIKNLPPDQEQAIKDALAIGFQCYKKRFC